MPFPTPQGTQAIVGMMVRALREQGHQAHLLTYAHGQPDPDAAMDVEPRRLPDWPRVRATRSGPSLGKLALDLRMVAALRAERARTGAQLLVAHNVEAAWACAAAGVAPFVYYAHTSMRDELPYYLPRALHPLTRPAGNALDRGACTRAASVFALTPALATRLHPLHRRVELVLPPFERPASTPPSRIAARSQLGLPLGAPIALYAGNLDAYQGIELLLGALGRAPSAWQLLVATASAPEPLRALAVAHGVAGRVVFAPLANEHDRAVAHAAADVALVPRLASGGCPSSCSRRCRAACPWWRTSAPSRGSPSPTGSTCCPWWTTTLPRRWRTGWSGSGGVSRGSPTVTPERPPWPPQASPRPRSSPRFSGPVRARWRGSARDPASGSRVIPAVTRGPRVLGHPRVATFVGEALGRAVDGLAVERRQRLRLGEPAARQGEQRERQQRHTEAAVTGGHSSPR